MENFQKASTWRELLNELIEDSDEKERIARAAHVQPITLVRWSQGISRPREDNMRMLLKAMHPSVYLSLVRLIANDFPELTRVEALNKQVKATLPTEFYERILSAYTQTPHPICRQVIQDLIFQQAIEHLDPERRGMLLSLIVCVSPLKGHVVRSLREIGGIGTPPWKRDLEQRTILVGAESLSGYALTNFRRVVVSNRARPTLFPVHWTEHEQSVAAVPIAKYGNLAGCLLAASVVPDYFVEGQPSVLVLEAYAHLAALIFEPHEFFALDQFQLGFMPSYELQLPYFQDFNRLVLQQFRLAMIREIHCTLEEVRGQAWREIEQSLIDVFAKTAINSNT